jgi:hypothetical protein
MGLAYCNCFYLQYLSVATRAIMIDPNGRTGEGAGQFPAFYGWTSADLVGPDFAGFAEQALTDTVYEVFGVRRGCARIQSGFEDQMELGGILATTGSPDG